MSGLKFILDTNIVIGLLKANPKVIELSERVNLDLSVSSVSQITRMELLGFKGISDVEETIIQQFLQSCHVLLLDEVIEAETISLRKLTSLKLPDAIIAATARVYELELLSLDEKLTSQYRC